ncbi:MULTISPECIES: hypoxanthine-guanine phosphoribosyltransferase [Candidatus Methylopumilus]|uniref:hypoxanthine-guanine phosphoribosyltransferase n=1 Tax=Candidatus Methylopumilus TaxID=1679002 RepID=UPI00111EF457|nr:hypoxanthine-guanine phosphoribosyltransferase [Candidatus Methylopumilus planktonicus]QDD06924.1 hypoxanthine-guanine phosphoribosyltransferase [Candidatus Methylopumilus planktonicus]QDD08260.1 hypoxanthine-guanine phosphoribosyltransferase [Candidatus Methylopumilus planktonicus]QDD09587.1 hypoxanthine-guanine phosphoribosyltransferase [Candidatus Methylopumilus planktonicus]
MDTIQELISKSSVIYSEIEIKIVIQNIADQVNQTIKTDDLYVLCVMNGALIFAGQLLPRLEKNIQYSYVHATRYASSLTGGPIHWLVKPPIDIEGKTVLILDDILDEGITLREIAATCIAMKAKAIFTAVLFDKEIAKEKSYLPNFIGLKVPNRFVFGYGLDCKGLGRNLPHLYALD